MKTNLSSCCNAEVYTEFNDVGIGYNACSKCGNPCKLASPEVKLCDKCFTMKHIKDDNKYCERCIKESTPEKWENDLADLLDTGTPTEIRDFVRKLINKDK